VDPSGKTLATVDEQLPSKSEVGPAAGANIMAACEAYATRRLQREDAVRKEHQLDTASWIAERQRNKAVADSLALQQMQMGEKLQLATLPALRQVATAASGGAAATVDTATATAGLSPDAIVQLVDSSLTIALLASSECSKEELAEVIDSVKGIGHKIAVRAAVKKAVATRKVLADAASGGSSIH